MYLRIILYYVDFMLRKLMQIDLNTKIEGNSLNICRSALFYGCCLLIWIK